LFYIESTDKDASGFVYFTMRPDKVRCRASEATFAFDTNTLELVPHDEVVDVRSRRAQAAQLSEDAPAIRAIRQVLGGRRMPFTALSLAAAQVSGIGEKSIRRVIDRYVSSDPGDPAALWIETYVRATNARMISCRPVQTAKPAEPDARKSKSDSADRPEIRMDAGFGKFGKVGRVGKFGRKEGASPCCRLSRQRLLFQSERRRPETRKIFA
jgi:hypothetical protein